MNCELCEKRPASFFLYLELGQENYEARVCRECYDRDNNES